MSTGMKRYQQFLLGAVVLLLAWGSAMYCSHKNIGMFATPQMKQIVPVLPLYAVVSYGAYSLASIGWALIVFNDVPHEAVLLEKEIEQAKSDLAQRGFKF